MSGRQMENRRMSRHPNWQMYVAEIKINFYEVTGKKGKKGEKNRKLEIRMKKRKIRQDRPDTPVRHAGQEVSWFHDGTDQGDAARRHGRCVC